MVFGVELGLANPKVIGAAALWRWFPRVFVGNARDGRTAAILAILTSSCRRHEVDTRNSISPTC
jgi:hypothetical protein